MIDFFVPGTPLPKQSFRYTANGGGFTDHKVKAWQSLVSWHAQGETRGDPMLTGDLEVLLVFCLPDKRPKDLDNLSKAVLDAMNGIVYKDDKQITRLTLEKSFGDCPGVAVSVKPFGGNVRSYPDKVIG